MHTLIKTLSKSTDTNQGKLRNYAFFKTIFQKEKCLSVINNVDIRKRFMSFRISAHILKIEVDRYKTIPALNRICKLCSYGEVEDERHLIFSCNKYSSLRQSFFTETQKICNNFSTLTQDAQFFWLKVIYKGCFKSFVALYADRICSDQHFVENCIEKFPSV